VGATFFFVYVDLSVADPDEVIAGDCSIEKRATMVTRDYNEDVKFGGLKRCYMAGNRAVYSMQIQQNSVASVVVPASTHEAGGTDNHGQEAKHRWSTVRLCRQKSQ